MESCVSDRLKVGRAVPDHVKAFLFQLSAPIVHLPTLLSVLFLICYGY